MSAVVNPAKGVIIYQGVTVTGTTTYTAIAQVKKLGGPKGKVITRKTTDLGSSATSSAAAIPDFSDGVSGTMNLDPKTTIHAALIAVVAAPPLFPDKWKMVFNDVTNGPSTWIQAGTLTEFSVGDQEVEGNLEADFAIETSGLPTWS